MSSSHLKIKNFRRAALFIVPLYVVVALGFYFSPHAATLPAKHSAPASVSTFATNSESGIISRVIDGDTIDVLIGDTTERVRLIGIDTPETVDPRKPVQCFGKEASEKTEGLLPQGMIVSLISDPTQDDRDKYGRLLRYITASDGTDIQLFLIEEGFGREYTYDIPYERQTEYKKAQREAQAAGHGLWAKNACNGGL